MVLAIFFIGSIFERIVFVQLLLFFIIQILFLPNFQIITHRFF